MRTFKYSLLGLSSALIFFACGDDVTKVTEVTNSGLEVVASADSLGKCTEEILGEMKFAQKENAVYVCTDSSWKNISAVENVACFVESLKDSSGYKIVCGGDSVGVVLNGKNGKKGEAGAEGKSCTVELLSDNSAYKVVCDGDSVGTIRDGLAGEGCTITDNGDGSVMQGCGSDTVNLYKAFCGGNVYDPDSSFCFDDSVVTLCGGKSYDLSVSFCYGDSVVALCSGKTYAPSSQECFENKLFETITDVRDGQKYRIVTIGDQTWMAQNLNYAYMPDTSSFCYDNDSANCKKYGRLYTWSAAMDSAARFSDNGKDCGYGKKCSPADTVRGACPVGWHLPEWMEWSNLVNFIAEKTGDYDSIPNALTSTSGWDDDLFGESCNGSDTFGFGVFPAGWRKLNGEDYELVRSYGGFWLFNKIDDSVVSVPIFSCGTLSHYSWFKNTSAISVRCVKD